VILRAPYRAAAASPILIHSRTSFRTETAAFQVKVLAATKPVIFRNVDRAVWEMIAKEFQGVRVVVVLTGSR